MTDLHSIDSMIRAINYATQEGAQPCQERHGLNVRALGSKYLAAVRTGYR